MRKISVRIHPIGKPHELIIPTEVTKSTFTFEGEPGTYCIVVHSLQPKVSEK